MGASSWLLTQVVAITLVRVQKVQLLFRQLLQLVQAVLQVVLEAVGGGSRCTKLLHVFGEDGVQEGRL